MFKTKNRRKSFIKTLREIAEGKESDLNPEQAKRWVKYLTRKPQSLVEAEVHKLFVKYCQYQGTDTAIMIDFWTEILSGSLDAFGVSGQDAGPENVDDLLSCSRLIFSGPGSSSITPGFLEKMDEESKNRFKTFLFQFNLDDCRKSIPFGRLDSWYDEIKQAPEGVQTFVAFLYGNGNLFIFHNPRVSIIGAAAFLRDDLQWWLNQ